MPAKTKQQEAPDLILDKAEAGAEGTKDDIASPSPVEQKAGAGNHLPDTDADVIEVDGERLDVEKDFLSRYLRLDGEDPWLLLMRDTKVPLSEAMPHIYVFWASDEKLQESLAKGYQMLKDERVFAPGQLDSDRESRGCIYVGESTALWMPKRVREEIEQHRDRTLNTPAENEVERFNINMRNMGGKATGGVRREESGL